MSRRTSLVVLTVLVASFLLGIPALVRAADPAPASPGYICTKCKIGADKAGKCPLCGAEMKKAGAYVCPVCDTTSDTPGKCACGRDYVKIELAAVKCPGCGYYYSKELGSCPVCKAAAAKKG